eukprot:1463837-Pleurochrysis_carterae.AAC.1
MVHAACESCAQADARAGQARRLDRRKQGRNQSQTGRTATCEAQRGAPAHARAPPHTGAWLLLHSVLSTESLVLTVIS